MPTITDAEMLDDIVTGIRASTDVAVACRKKEIRDENKEHEQSLNLGQSSSSKLRIDQLIAHLL